MSKLPEYDPEMHTDEKGNFLRFKSDSERQYHWITNAPVKTYAQVKEFFERARFPEKGKPLRAWARVHKRDNKAYGVDNWTGEFCRFMPSRSNIAPDGKCVFTATVEEVWRSSHTLTGALHRALPFHILRVGKGRYRIAHVDKILKELGSDSYDDDGWASYYLPDTWVKKNAPEYFQGITFDLFTGECLNARPDDELIVIAEKRLVWLRALRKFKAGIKVRAKMNVFEGISDTIEREKTKRDTHHSMPDWSTKHYHKLLYTSIRDCKFSPELLKGIAESNATYYWNWTRPTPAAVIDTVKKICDTRSVDLRREFGVFEKQVVKKGSKK